MKKTTIIILFCFSFLHSFAQNELSFGIGGGISELNYKPLQGKQSLGFGPEINIRFNHYFNEHIGIATGLDFSQYVSNYTIDKGFTIEATGVDDGDNYTLTSSLTNYKEKQQASYISIPLLLLYKTSIADELELFLFGGLRVGFGINSKYKTPNYYINSSAYFPIYNISFDDLPEYGFGNMVQEPISGKYDFGINTQLSFEIGINRLLEDYTGSIAFSLYMNYGLNNINKTTTSENLHNGIINYEYNGQPVVNNINATNAGVKIAYVFNITEYKETRREAARRQAEYKEKMRIKAYNDSIKRERRKAVRDSLKEVQRIQDSINKENIKTQQVLKDSIAKAAPKPTTKSIEKQVANINTTNEAKKALAKLSTTNIGGFVIGKSDIDTNMGKEIDLVIAILKKFPDINIILYGHSCDIGTKETNMKVGMDRALHTKEYIVSKGIDEQRISVVSKGDTEPLVPNTSEENRVANRRVTFEVRK